ncbi:MAG: haloacid dehalogenase type II [Hyphomicrobiales bacterium]|nr:haloacid dehalogenase type II [Hyphomicrobiales bacterium]MDE2374244.1 haloacid dehalogenase type II [Hyphomicrobiales bacterium]
MMLSAYVFDAYGTLFDVHAAIDRHRAAVGADAQRFSELWRTKQLEYSWTLTLAGHYVDFSKLTERALDFAFARFPSVDRGLRAKLLEAYLTLDAFPDVHTALTGLKSRGARLAILSNGTPAMLGSAIEAAAMQGLLDGVFSVDAVRRYKPRREVYALVTEGLGIEPSDTGFVSSNRWDVMGAVSFGFKAFWINRSGAPNEYPDQRPELEIPGLGALLQAAL